MYKNMKVGVQFTFGPGSKVRPPPTGSSNMLKTFFAVIGVVTVVRFCMKKHNEKTKAAPTDTPS